MATNQTDPDKNQSLNNEDEIDTSLIDEQWSALTQDWQQQPTEKANIQQLLKQTKQRTRKAKSLFVANIIATIGLFVSALYGTFSENSWERPLVGYLWGSFVLSVIFCYYEYKIRQASWQQLSDSPDQAIQNAIKGHESSLSYIRLTKWSCLPFGVLANFFIYEAAVNAEKPILFGLLLINGFILFVYGVTHWFGVKRKRELDGLLAKMENN